MPEPTDVHPPLGDDVLWIPRIAGEILGTTHDQLIDLVRAGQLVARSVDGMLMFREGDLYAPIGSVRCSASSSAASPNAATLASPACARAGTRSPKSSSGSERRA